MIDKKRIYLLFPSIIYYGLGVIKFTINLVFYRNYYINNNSLIKI